MTTLKDGELYSGLEGNQPIVYAVTQIPFPICTVLTRLSDQKFSV